MNEVCPNHSSMRPLLTALLVLQSVALQGVLAIRLVDQIAPSATYSSSSKTAIFALGSFWQGEAVFGCLKGVLRTTAGYTGGSKPNPEYRNIGDHAEAVEVEFDPSVIRYEQLLDVFWSSHDPTQLFGQGPDVGDQYRSAIFVQGPEQKNLASLSKVREETMLVKGILTTEIEQAGVFFPAEPEHQKFELRRKPQLMQLLGNVAADQEFSRSRLVTRLNAYAAGMCSLSTKKDIDSMIDTSLKCRLNLQQILHR